MNAQKKKKTLFQKLVRVLVPLAITLVGAHVSQVDTQILDAVSESVIQVVDVVSQ